MRDPLRRAEGGLRVALFMPRGPTQPYLLHLCRVRIASGYSNPVLTPDCQDRIITLPVKEKVTERSKMPSTDEGHLRACVGRCQSCLRSHDAFRKQARPSAPFRVPFPVWRLRVHPGLRSARPPSPPIVPLRALARGADWRFSGSDCRPSTSAATNSDAWAHLRAPDSREISPSPHRCGFGA